MYELRVRLGKGSRRRQKGAPNDAPGVVLGLRFIFFPSCFSYTNQWFLFYLGSICIEGTRKVGVGNGKQNGSYVSDFFPSPFDTN
jgi:hypothetical protein